MISLDAARPPAPRSDGCVEFCTSSRAHVGGAIGAVLVGSAAIATLVSLATSHDDAPAPAMTPVQHTPAVGTVTSPGLAPATITLAP